MPKDEFDFEDPLELNGMAILSSEDTTNDMAECFTEEFMRLGYDHRRIFALFANPHYLGPNLAFQQRGELFIRNLIADVFARWGKAVSWSESRVLTGSVPKNPNPDTPESPPDRGLTVDVTAAALLDPTGAPIPRFVL